MFTPGEILKDRYIIASFIARGTSGAVFLGEDIWTRMPVAIKVSATLLGLRETTSLSHEKVIYGALHGVPGIHNVQEYITANRRHIFVLPYLGKSIREIFLTRGRLTRAEACRMGVSMLDTLEGMHQRGVLHLDVKPDNILYDGKYHLIDYGSARFTTSTMGRCTGTPAFRSMNIDVGGLADKIDDYESLMYTICAVAGELPWINEEWQVTDGRLKLQKTQNRKKIGNRFPLAFRRAWETVRRRSTNYEEMKKFLSLAVLQAEVAEMEEASKEAMAEANMLQTKVQV